MHGLPKSFFLLSSIVCASRGGSHAPKTQSTPPHGCMLEAHHVMKCYVYNGQDKVPESWLLGHDY